MLDKIKIVKVLSVAVAAALIINPAQAMAWGGESNWNGRDNHHNRHDRDRDSYRHKRHSHHDHFRHSRHYPRHGSIIFDLPFGVVKVNIGGKRYYYCDGVFYHRSNLNYVVIPPPVGAVVTDLPFGMQRIIINGTDYYTSDGIYYRYSPQGYVVVPSPTAVIYESAKPYKVDLTTDSLDSFIVNVANAKGGYTAVAIKKSGDGFVGPQGEFYPEFPKVEQLKVMYGK